MLKMRSRGRVNAQAARYHQSLPNPHISKTLQRQTKKEKDRTVSQSALSIRMGAVTWSSVFVWIASIKEQSSVFPYNYNALPLGGMRIEKSVSS